MKAPTKIISLSSNSLGTSLVELWFFGTLGLNLKVYEYIYFVM